MSAMDERTWLAQQFEENRPRLHAAARRMLGSAAEADDAVQEAWLRLDRSGAEDVENLPGWLTTVVARVCLNMLRSRRTRGEAPLDAVPEASAGEHPDDPEHEALLGDSVGLALLVVLDSLKPPERLAFVLHDVFDLSFDEIAPIVGRTPAAARQLASRARRRVRGAALPEPDHSRQRRVVDAYLAATSTGDFEGLLAILDPDVLLRADADAVPGGVATLLRGADTVARAAMASTTRARHTRAATVDGSVGLVMSVADRPQVVLRFTLVDDLVTEIDVVGSAGHLQRLDIVELED